MRLLRKIIPPTSCNVEPMKSSADSLCPCIFCCLIKIEVKDSPVSLSDEVSQVCNTGEAGKVRLREIWTFR
jgi:hypothetical protein